jgi:5-methyltetrahydropteroyltriglutamate--homocysteine methyltransferase
MGYGGVLKSEERIVTTHAGSLPRPKALSKLLIDQDHDRPVDPTALSAAIAEATERVVVAQLENGIDVGGDGEQARAGYSTYPAQRMGGFGGESTRNDLLDMIKFPMYAEAYRAAFRTGPEERTRIVNAPKAIAALKYDPECSGVRAECETFEAAPDKQGQRFGETFITAASPGCVLTIMNNDHYPSDRDYLFALAKELKTEYDFIVRRGHLLQIDARISRWSATFISATCRTPTFSRVSRPMWRR